MKKIVFLIGFVVCLGMLNISVYAYQYVENATEVSTSGSWTNPTNIYDNNYSTYASHADTDTNYYANYTIPVNHTINNSIWQKKDGYSFVNITLTTTCSEHDNKLVLRSLIQEGGGSSFHRYYCLNNVSVWVLIGGYGDASNEWLYEEAMFFNETPPPPPPTIYNFTECEGNLILYETGSDYNFSTEFGGYVNFLNINDTNYSTYGTYRGCETDYFYVNYTLPDNILNINSTLWQYKDETIFANFSIDNVTHGCFNPNFDKLQFQILTTETTPRETYLKCFNGSSFETFRTNIQNDIDIYEEGLYFCLTPPALNGSYVSYYCSDDYSVKNTTILSGVNITGGFNVSESLEFYLCENGCDEDNLIIDILDNNPNLCNPKEWLSWVYFIVALIGVMALLKYIRFYR